MTLKSDTITIELCASEALAITELIHARLSAMTQEPETETRQEELEVLHSINLKLFIETLPMAIREAMDEQGRLN
jgi:hypothetical protein